MFEENTTHAELELRRQRLKALQETHGWREDVRPFLLARYEAAMTAIQYEEDMTHWKAVGIELHIDHLMSFIEGEKWRNRAVAEPPKPKAERKRNLRERVANLFRR